MLRIITIAVFAPYHKRVFFFIFFNPGLRIVRSKEEEPN